MSRKALAGRGTENDPRRPIRDRASARIASSPAPRARPCQHRFEMLTDHRADASGGSSAWCTQPTT